MNGNAVESNPSATMATSLAVSREAYLHEAQFALFGCQMVEEALKSMLMYAREVNLLTSDSYAPVQKTDEELDELPLGPLIRLYEKVFPKSLVAVSLHALRPERNHCAHQPQKQYCKR